MRKTSARRVARVATVLTAVVALLPAGMVGTAQAHHGDPGWDALLWNDIPRAGTINTDARAVTVWENGDGRRTTRAQVRFYALHFSGGYLRVLDSFSDNRTAYGQIQVWRNGRWEHHRSYFTTASNKDIMPLVSVPDDSRIRVQACASKKGAHRTLDPASCAAFAYGYYDY